MTAIDLAIGALRASRAAGRANREGVYRDWAALVMPGGVTCYEMTREEMIDEAVRRTTHDTERRILMSDFNRYGEWHSFSRHVVSRIRAEFHLMAAQ